ncbi:MAG: hypothetical protein QF371_02215 [Flavobacteriales bacterium]|jgi:hypothetical protein|nr:hypothetical protein [Flavobacteriales bacterium]
MNRPAILILLFWVVLSLAQGCKPDFTAESNVVSTMLGVLKKVESTSNEVDVRLVKQYLKDVKEKCTKIQAEMTDTIGIEDAQILVNFCALNEHFQSCLDRKELIDSEIVDTRNQLYDLHTDLKERRADKDSVNNYIEGEFLYVESLDEGAERVVAELNGCFETYSELKEEIDRLLISLPSKVEE